MRPRVRGVLLRLLPGTFLKRIPLKYLQNPEQIFALQKLEIQTILNWRYAMATREIREKGLKGKILRVICLELSLQPFSKILTASQPRNTPQSAGLIY